MPEPRKEGESHQDFMDRCMSYMDSEEPDPKRRAAICIRKSKGEPQGAVAELVTNMEVAHYAEVHDLGSTEELTEANLVIPDEYEDFGEEEEDFVLGKDLAVAAKYQGRTVKLNKPFRNRIPNFMPNN